MKNKKQFAIKAILPYFIDQSLCAVDPVTNVCAFNSPNGNKCVVGKHMKPEFLGNTNSIGYLIKKYGQHNVFQNRAINVLTDKEWGVLQDMHDKLAYNRYRKRNVYFSNVVENSGLFTMKELTDYANKNKPKGIRT